MKRLQGKVVVIAGGAGGIGSATSQRMAAEGAHVIVADLNAEQAGQVAEDIRARGGEARATRVDLASEDSIAALFNFALASYGRVNCLHVNAADVAGIGSDLDALDIGLDTWHRSLQINLTGYLLCTRAALPELLRQGGGAIVYTGSGASFYPEKTRVAYGVAKAGIGALMRHVAIRWGKQNIRANVVAPGAILTPPMRALPQERQQELLALTNSPRLGDAQDIAAMVAHLFSEDGAWINGQTLSVDGGMTMR